MKAGDSTNIDVRIKRLSRRILCDLAPSRDGLLRLSDYLRDQSDYFWSLASDIDRTVKGKLQKDPKWQRDRPKAAEIASEENRLREFIGRDVQKLEVLEKALTKFSFQKLLLLSPEEIGRKLDVDLETVKELWTALTRGKPGRPPQAKSRNFAQEAARLSEKGLSSGQIAQRKLPELYASDPDKASARVRSAINRSRKKLPTHENQN